MGHSAPGGTATPRKYRSPPPLPPCDFDKGGTKRVPANREFLSVLILAEGSNPIEEFGSGLCQDIVDVNEVTLHSPILSHLSTAYQSLPKPIGSARSEDG